MNVDYFYYLFKFIRDGLLNGFIVPYEWKYDKIENIIQTANTVGVFVKVELLKCGIIVLSRSSYKRHKKKIHLLNMDDPPDFLLGLILGYPVKMLPHGHEKTEAICITFIAEETRIVVHSVRCGVKEMDRIREEGENYLRFMNRYTRDSYATFTIEVY